MSLNLLFRSVARMRKADVIEERVIREIYAEKTKMNSAEAEFYNAISDNVWDYAASQGVHEGFLMAGAQKMLSSSPQAAFLHWEGKDNLSSEKAEYDNYLPSEACSTGEESSKSGFFDVLRKTALYFEKKDELLAVDSKLNELVKALNFFWQKHPKEKVLLFSFYKITLRYLEKKLKSLGFKVLRYDGDIPNEDRGRIMEDFKKGDYQILLASEIAAEGIDLQFMKCVVNYDLPWNPARVEQRIGRVDRIGQESLKIFVYNLFYRGTIDETVYDRLLSRLGIFERSLGLCEDVV
ncbi:C-terminal helicase domain-containing protein [Parasutterella sp.]|uniref:C-terminal helicase domain-containing protein n=2 Tax=Parasutterella sp. TaxID=2049037 RepID=UPI00307A5190